MAGFLEELVNGGHLDGTALGITKLVIDKGVGSLSDKQTNVFEKQVMEKFVVEECSLCGGIIPWSEMYMAMDTKICGYCTHKLEKIEKE